MSRIAKKAKKELHEMAPEEQATFWRDRQQVSREMDVENVRRELAVKEAVAVNPDLMGEYCFRRVKPLLDQGFTPEMVSALVDTPVEDIHIANQVYGFINQTAKERGQAVLDRHAEAGTDVSGWAPSSGADNGFGYF